MVDRRKMPMPCSFDFEFVLWNQGASKVAGIDEAGRGPIAGPVVAAAVILPKGYKFEKLDDSKKLSRNTRERLFDKLTSHPEVCFGVGVIEPDEIDRINILRATHAAMRLALQALPVPPQHALIDGLPVHPFPCPQTAVVAGDSLSFSIAAASVIAKVSRDLMMAKYHTEFPEYGFADHQGYATARHLASLRQHGPCRIHRRSFAPVSQAVFSFA